MEERLDQTEQEETAPVKKTGKKRWLIRIAVLVAAIVLINLGCYIYKIAGNTYKTPVALDERNANDRFYKSDLELYYRTLNGFAKKEAKAVFEAVKKTDSYQQSLEEEKLFFREKIGFNDKAYGINWSVRYKVVESEKLDDAALARYSESLVACAETLEANLTGNAQVDESLKAYAAKLREAQVTEGYDLSVRVVFDGIASMPEAMEEPMTVYKVDGRWVKEENLTEFAEYAIWYAQRG